MRLLSLLLSLGVLAGCGTAKINVPPGVAVVVTLGDSVPAGTACACQPFPDLYARSQHAVSENLAVPGYTSADVRAQIAGVRVALAGADEVVLMIGANDLAAALDDGTSLAAAAADVRANVTATITAVERIRRTAVVVLGYWNVVEDGQVAADEYAPAEVRAADDATTRANAALRAAATATGATYIATDVAFHGSDGEQDPTDLLAADGDHPDAAGHALIAGLLPPIGPPGNR